MRKVRLNWREINREIFFMIPRVVSQHCTALGPERAYLSLAPVPPGVLQKKVIPTSLLWRRQATCGHTKVLTCNSYLVPCGWCQIKCSVDWSNYHLLHLSDFNVVSWPNKSWKHWICPLDDGSLNLWLGMKAGIDWCDLYEKNPKSRRNAKLENIHQKSSGFYDDL